MVLCGAEKTRLLTRIKPVTNLTNANRKLPVKSKRIESAVVLSNVSRKMPRMGALPNPDIQREKLIPTLLSSRILDDGARGIRENPHTLNPRT